MRTFAVLVSTAFVVGCAGTKDGPQSEQADYSIGAALTSSPGDPARGQSVIMGRDGNCLLCHALPETGARFMGNLGPSLSGVGARLTAGQLRLRLVDSKRLNPESIMPSYFQTEGLRQVAEAYRGKTVLTAQQIEDTIAYLMSLR